MRNTTFKRAAVSMPAGSRSRGQMLEEASMQEKALKRLAAWEVNSATFAAFGIILAFCGLISRFLPAWAGVLGVIAAVLFAAAAAVLHISIRHGRRNVQAIKELLKEPTK